MIVWIVTILALIGIALIVYLMRRKDEGLLKVYSNVQERTAAGVLVASKDGTSEPMKAWIDLALTKLFFDARAKGYQAVLNYFNYTVYVLPNCVLSPVNQTPSFILRADQYDGTIFDIDPTQGVGRIYAAELVVNFETCEFVICDSRDESYVKNAVRFGAEHLILWHNDRSEYERTKFHGNGEIAHPLIGVSV